MPKHYGNGETEKKLREDIHTLRNTTRSAVLVYFSVLFGPFEAWKKRQVIFLKREALGFVSPGRVYRYILLLSESGREETNDG